MRIPAALFFLSTLGAATAAAQTSAAPLRLTVDDAVRMALESNVDLAADRLDPQIGDTQVAAAAGVFRPSFVSSTQRNNQLQPPSNFLIPLPLQTDLMSSNVGISQRLPWFGTQYSVAWDTSHTETNNILNSYNPLVRSGFAFSLSQPLLRDRATDAARLQITLSQNARTQAGTRLDESIVQTTAAVKTAYWNLVAARANVDARRTSLQLSEELTRVNRAKVEVGQSPPLDLLSAQAEVAANQEQLIVAETSVRQAEDRLRVLIFDGTKREVWNLALEPADAPPVSVSAIDVEAAITNALRSRGDLARARTDVANANTATKLSSNQRLPDVRANATYQASGLGGTEILRTGGFPGTIVGAGNVTGYSSVFNQLLSNDYPTWAVGLSVSYPIGRSVDDANYARSVLQARQAEQRVKASEARTIQQVRDTAWKVEMNARRMDTTRLARELAEQRLDAEQKRFEVGMSTSFLVIQAQRDLAQARTGELSSILAYDLSLVDFEAIQLASPSGSSAGSGVAGLTTVVPVSSSRAATAAGQGAAALNGLPAGIF